MRNYLNHEEKVKFVDGLLAKSQESMIKQMERDCVKNKAICD